MTIAENTVSDSQKVNLLNFDRSGLQKLFSEVFHEAPFRADQVLKWIHQQGVTDFAEMTNLSKSLRSALAEQAEIVLPEVLWEKVASDGTHKWLLRLADGNSIETVFIPEKTRGTLCVSSQVGCALDCRFCSTGKQGFSRDLTTAEIIGQLWFAVRRLASASESGAAAAASWQITNVVMMGMGEPLLNFDSVVAAMNLMLEDLAYGLSKYRVTLSTSGVIPAMLRLKTISPVSLAVSLHAPNNALRDVLVPLNRKYPLEQLLPVCRSYFEGQGKRVVTFEYVMLKGVNDSAQHAAELATVLKSVPCKINLIPFNPFALSSYQCTAMEEIRQFQAILQKSGLHVTVRKTRGDDIDAACGQLVGKFQDRTTRHVRWLKKASAERQGSGADYD